LVLKYQKNAEGSICLLLICEKVAELQNKIIFFKKPNRSKEELSLNLNWLNFKNTLEILAFVLQIFDGSI
jgi:hypothetical protein